MENKQLDKENEGKKEERSLLKDLLVTSLYVIPVVTIGKAFKGYLEKYDKEKK